MRKIQYRDTTTESIVSHDLMVKKSLDHGWKRLYFPMLNKSVWNVDVFVIVFYQTHSNERITALVHELFTLLSMVVPHKFSKQSCGTTEQESSREYSNMEFSYDSGRSSIGEPSHQRGSIPKSSFSMPLIACSDPSHPDRILNSKLWEHLRIARVPDGRQKIHNARDDNGGKGVIWLILLVNMCMTWQRRARNNWGIFNMFWLLFCCSFCKH
jgi:hypothetical protein